MTYKVVDRPFHIEPFASFITLADNSGTSGLFLFRARSYTASRSHSDSNRDANTDPGHVVGRNGNGRANCYVNTDTHADRLFPPVQALLCVPCQSSSGP